MLSLKWIEAQEGDWRLVKFGELWYVERKTVCSYIPSDGLKTLGSALKLYNKMLKVGDSRRIA